METTLKINERTKTILIQIGFDEQELPYFTQEQADETIQKFNEKLRRTKNWKNCSVKVEG